MYKTEIACRMYRVTDWSQRLIKALENQKCLLDNIDNIEKIRNRGRYHRRRAWWWVCNASPKIAAERNRYRGGVRAKNFEDFFIFIFKVPNDRVDDPHEGI